LKHIYTYCAISLILNNFQRGGRRLDASCVDVVSL